MEYIAYKSNLLKLLEMRRESTGYHHKQAEIEGSIKTRYVLCKADFSSWIVNAICSVCVRQTLYCQQNSKLIMFNSTTYIWFKLYLNACFRINKLFKILEHWNQVKIWLSHIQFLKTSGWEEAVSRLYLRLLQVKATLFLSFLFKY